MTFDPTQFWLNTPVSAHGLPHDGTHALNTQAEPGLTVLTRDECLTLLASAQVGRLGVSIDAMPAILPVNFAYVNDKIVIRTGDGSKLDAAVNQSVVAFEADSYDRWGTWGWSVLVRGWAERITDVAELDDLNRHPLRAWAFGDRQPGRYLGIDLAIVSGRRFGQPPEWAAEAAVQE